MGQDDTNDLALLQTDLLNASLASFRFAARLGEFVATYGFPFPGLFAQDTFDPGKRNVDLARRAVTGQRAVCGLQSTRCLAICSRWASCLPLAAI